MPSYVTTVKLGHAKVEILEQVILLSWIFATFVFIALWVLTSVTWMSLLAEKMVPGVIYGLDDENNTLKLCIKLPQKDVLQQLRARGSKFENTLFEIIVNNDKFLVVPRQTQFSPSKFIIHA